MDHVTYCLADFCPRYDDTVSSYIAKLAKKAKSLKKAHSFGPKDPIITVGLLATFRLTCVSKKSHESAAMWVLPHYVQVTLANALSSCMCAEVRLKPFATSVQNILHRSCKLLWSYLEC